MAPLIILKGNKWKCKLLRDFAIKTRYINTWRVAPYEIYFILNRVPLKLNAYFSSAFRKETEFSKP
jgi:hypothetical protein